MKTSENLRLPMYNGTFLSHTPVSDAEATKIETSHADSLAQVDKDAKKATSANKQKATNAAKAAAQVAVNFKNAALSYCEDAEAAKTIGKARKNGGLAIAAYKNAKEAAKTAQKEANKFGTPKALEAAELAKDAVEIAKMASNRAFEAGSQDSALKLMAAKFNNRSNY